MPKRPLSLREIMLRDVLIALSLANLFFYKIWSELYFQPMAFQEFFILVCGVPCAAFPAPRHDDSHASGLRGGAAHSNRGHLFEAWSRDCHAS